MFTIRTSAAHLLTVVGTVCLLAGCGGAESETRTGASELSGDCETSLDACKTRCRSVPDQASRGPCFDQCLRDVQSCRDE